jgi:hypothetical protein
MALTPPDAPFRCCVIGTTKVDAETKFATAQEAWAELAEMPDRLRVAN